MASRNSGLEGTKQRIKGKLLDIHEQANILHEIINGLKEEAIEDGEALLQQKSKTKFFHKFPVVNQKLEESLSRLLLIKDAIDSLDDEDDQSGSEEGGIDETRSEKSTLTVTSVVTKPETIIHKKHKELKNESIPADRELTITCEPSKTKEVQATVEASVVSKTVAEVKPDSVHAPVEKWLTLDEIDSTLGGEKQKEPAGNYASSIASDSNSGGLSKRSSSNAPTSKKMQRIPSASSVSQLLPQVLSDDVKVPGPIIRYDTALTLLVTEKKTPWSFYVQVHDGSYDRFMEELCLHFSRQASQGYKGGISNIPNAGCYCCAKTPHDSTWYRAQVQNIKTIEACDDTKNDEYCPSESVMSCYDDPVLNSIQATVFLIDEGTIVDVPLRNLRPLERKFSQLPAQAIHCKLGGVAPLLYGEHSDDDPWSEQSIDWFNDVINSEHFFTGYIHRSVNDPAFLPVDLYSGEHTIGSDASLPPIEENIGHMMLVVNMASPLPQTESHLKSHYLEIDRISYKSPTLSDSNFFKKEEPKQPFVDISQSQNENPSLLTELEDEMNKMTMKDSDYNGNVGRSRKDTKQVYISHNKRPETAENYVRATQRTDASAEAVMFEVNEVNPQLQSEFPTDATFENHFKEKTFNVGQEGFCPVVVSNVRDPALFYVHLITPDVVMFDAMLNELNKIYSDTEFPIPGNRLSTGNAVVVKFSEDGSWYRGLITRLRIPDSGDYSPREEPRPAGIDFEYEVLHVDFGSSEWVKHADIRPVMKKFFELPMETLPCCMADIEPMEISRDVSTSSTSSSNGIDNESKSRMSLKMNSKAKKPKTKKQSVEIVELAAGDEDFYDVFHQGGPTSRNGSWSDKAIKRFQELSVDGQQRIASLKDRTSTKRLPVEPWPVYLYDTNGDVDVLINQVLVDEALAVSNVYTKSTEEKGSNLGPKRVVITEQELEKIVQESKGTQGPTSPLSPTSSMMNTWDPMKDAFLSDRNAYTIDVDDAGVATTGYAEPKRNFCRHFLSGSGCRRGASCPYEHARPGDPSRIKHEAFCINFTREHLSNLLPDIGDFVLTQITVIMTPINFYVRLPLGPKPFNEIISGGSFTQDYDDTDELIDLRERMTKLYSKMPYRESEMIPFVEGELVATKFTQDDNWYRARIIDVSEREYTVFYIDYGNTEVVKGKNIRKLVPEFAFLEPQAIEVFLSGVEMKDDAKSDLMKDSIECFEEMIGDGIVISRVMSKAINGTLYLELYDKHGKTNINEEMLKKSYFERSTKVLTRPWDMSKAISVNQKIQHLIPG